MRIRIEPFDLASPYFEAAARVCAEVFGDECANSLRFIEKYTRYPGFLGLAALTGEQVVALGFGISARPGQWWHDKVAAQIGYDHPALQNAWVLTQLGVLAPYRNRGIGGRLHDALLRRQPCRRLLLSVAAHNIDAQRFYERRRWRVLHTGLIFIQSDAPYTIMSRTWRRSATRRMP